MCVRGGDVCGQTNLRMVPANTDVFLQRLWGKRRS